MARWLLFAAWTASDKALWNSHWIAEQTARLAPVPATRIEREGAVREALEAALADEELEGVALFGHGLPHAVRGSDGREALNLDNVKLVGARWAHAIACNTGIELVPASVTHVDLFVGYDVALIVEWEPEALPAPLLAQIAELTTATTLALLEGIRTKAELQKRASIAAEGLTTWLLENTESGHYGLYLLAQQLVDRMVVSR